jgi:3-methylcrotonyl-CoA carboxylase beta subunit
MHAHLSGVSDYTAAEDDADALRIGRLIMQPPGAAQAGTQPGPPRRAGAPAYDPDELLGVIPADPRKIPFDVREIIARLVDGSRFLEFKRDYGTSLVCGHAHH